MLKRAYSFLQIKSVDSEQRIIKGVATSASTDRMGDIVEPLGAEFKLPLPLLWQHDARQPIGNVIEAKATADGIEIVAQLAKTDVPGQLKDRLDMAWQSIAMGLVRGLSIGFQSLEEAFNKETYGFHILKWMWLELSAVTIPANQDASIHTIKSLDVGLAAIGPGRPVVKLHPPSGAADTRAAARRSSTMKKTYAEQIKDFEMTRTAKTARQDEIQTKASDESRSKDQTEKEEFDNLTVEIKAIDSELVDLKALETRAKQSAIPAVGETPVQGAEGRSGIVVLGRKLAPGIGFARYAMCIAKAKGSMSDAMEMARTFYPDTGLEQAIRAKAAVGAGATVTSHNLDDLVPYNILASDFIEYLRAGNIVDKFGTGGLPALNRVPFNVRVSGFSAGFTGNWRGEGKPVPVSKATSFNTSLTWANVEALAVLTNEEVRFSNPSAEAKVRNDIAKAINTRIDIDFVDPGKAAVANVSPASICDSIAAIPPTNTTAAALITDLASLLKPFATNLLDVSDVVLIMSASMALQISMMTTTLGVPYFPNITMEGGTLRGIRVLVSENLTSVGSPSTQTIVAVKASEVYLADDGNVSVDASDQASIEMLDSSLVQDGIAGTGASLVSLWQNGLLGIKASREITWKLRRSTAVQYISPAAYAA